MKKLFLTIAATLAVLSVGFGVTSASADEQGSGLQIVGVDYNVKGVDTAANAYKEAIKVQNKSAAPVSLSGCTLEDLTGHTYSFPSTRTLASGEYVYVRTGKSPSADPANWWNTQVNLYWGRSSHQYGNSADSVTLECAGSRLDRVAWNDFTIRP